MLATSDFTDGNAVIGKVRRCLTPGVGEQSRQACTAPAEEYQASAVHCGTAVTDLDRTCRCQRSDEHAAFNTRCSSSAIVFGDEARTELQ